MLGPLHACFLFVWIYLVELTPFLHYRAFKKSQQRYIVFSIEALCHICMLRNINCCSQEIKDLKVKADAITRLMERGYRVKVSSGSVIFSSFCMVLLMLSDNPKIC